MKIPSIVHREPLMAEAGVSKLFKIRFDRLTCPVLLKEPAQFWDEAFIDNEARMLEAVTHPRVRQRLAYDAEKRQLYLNYIEGDTLQSLIQSGTLSGTPDLIHDILQGVAATLADLHHGHFCKHPIIHNDLKSTNILLPCQAPRQPVLIDFSHSYFAGHLPSFITETKHMPCGTAKYLAPEKWHGDYSHGSKSDVFAFGVLAYYAWTGQYPFEGDVNQLKQQICHHPAPSPTQTGCAIPRNIMATIMLCLEKQPQRRPSMDYIAQCHASSAGLIEKRCN